MVYEPLNRRLALLASIFAFLGVLLGAIALGTNYWTINNTFSNVSTEPTYTTVWNGLFRICNNKSDICMAEFLSGIFFISLLGIVFLFIGGIFSALDVPKATNRRFLTPLLMFVASVLMTAGLVDYSSWYLLNSHSSRSMITAVVFSYTALSISSFVAGRYSALERGSSFNDDIHLTTQRYSATNGNGH